MGFDRYMCDKIKKAKECSRLDNWNILAWQLCEKKSPTKLKRNEAVENELTGGRMSLDSCASNDITKLAYQCIHKNAKTRVRICIPVMFPQQLTDGEVKRRTNWENETAMMQYIMVICNGDFYKMEQKVITLTWFEE